MELISERSVEWIPQCFHIYENVILSLVQIIILFIMKTTVWGWKAGDKQSTHRLMPTATTTSGTRGHRKVHLWWGTKRCPLQRYDTSGYVQDINRHPLLLLPPRVPQHHVKVLIPHVLFACYLECRCDGFFFTFPFHITSPHDWLNRTHGNWVPLSGTTLNLS